MSRWICDILESSIICEHFIDMWFNLADCMYLYRSTSVKSNINEAIQVLLIFQRIFIFSSSENTFLYHFCLLKHQITNFIQNLNILFLTITLEISRASPNMHLIADCLFTFWFKPIYFSSIMSKAWGL